MIEISLNNISKSFGFGNVLNNINLEIKTNDKIGIVGSNGSGKSTLIKLIMKEYLPDSGIISIKNNSKIGYLKQIPDIINDKVTVKDILYKNLNDINLIEEKLNKYELKMQSATDLELDKIINKYCELQEEYLNSDIYKIKENINKIIKEFKLEDKLLKYYNTLSGGEKRILLFANIIINNPNILILDEPTNHLDIEYLEILEKFLIKYNGTIIIISHDRYFLDKITNKTILIESGNAILFNGNYTYFVNENKKRLEKLKEEYNLQEKKIKNMNRQIKQLKEWSKIEGNEKFSKRAKSIEKRLDKLVTTNKPTNIKNIPISFNYNDRSGNEVLVLKNYSLKYGDNILIDNINLNILYGEKVCLMGNNGSGKSSLIKDIINNNKESIKIGSKINIGYIPQDIVFDNELKTVIEIAREYSFKEETYLRSDLNRFLFKKDDIFKRVNSLSGGERIRLKLFELINKDINFIILDEVTNHIDIETKEVLEKSLLDFKGTILFISHDRYFINTIATKIVKIENKKIITYNGNYDYYISKVGEL